MNVIGRSWRNPISDPPEENKVVNVVAPDGREIQLFKCGRLWFLPDGSMYMYWQPSLWCELDEDSK